MTQNGHSRQCTCAPEATVNCDFKHTDPGCPYFVPLPWTPMVGGGGGSGPPSVATLESAGLVCLHLESSAIQHYGNALLWPEEADALADALRKAAREIRDV